MYRYLSWSAFFSLSLCLSLCPGILSVNLRVYVRFLIPILFVSRCLWMRVAVSDYIMTYCRYNISVRLFWFVFLTLLFCECFYTCSAILTLILLTCIGTSLDPRLSLSFSLSVSVSEYIIRNLHVCEQTRSARSACNSAMEDGFFIFFILPVYVRLLISVSFSLLCVNVCTSVQLYYDWLYVHILLFFRLVILFLSEYPY